VARIRHIIKRWFPYLALLVVFVLWRLLVYPQGRNDPNHPDVLIDLLGLKMSGFVALAQYAVQDFLNVVLGSWAKTVDPITYVLTDRIVLISLGIAASAGIGAFFILDRFLHQ
jgi:hypothetical protein